MESDGFQGGVFLVFSDYRDFELSRFRFFEVSIIRRIEISRFQGFEVLLLQPKEILTFSLQNLRMKYRNKVFQKSLRVERSFFKKF